MTALPRHQSPAAEGWHCRWTCRSTSWSWLSSTGPDRDSDLHVRLQDVELWDAPTCERVPLSPRLKTVDWWLYSADGRCRCRFVADRCSFAARRRRFEPRVGLVARRRAGSGARPSATTSASFVRAISRLRSWDRRSEAVTVITPATRRRPRRVTSSNRWSSESTAESPTFHESSTRLSEVLTCWPPGPDERENRQPSSDEGIVSAGDTSRSIQPALHNMGVNKATIPAQGQSSSHRQSHPSRMSPPARSRELTRPVT